LLPVHRQLSRQSRRQDIHDEHIPGSQQPGSTSELTLGHTGSVYRVVWSPDGNNVATASFDKTAKILKAIMGHASIKTTEGYIGSDTDTMREQMKKVSLQARPASTEEVKREEETGKPNKEVAEEG